MTYEVMFATLNACRVTIPRTLFFSGTFDGDFARHSLVWLLVAGNQAGCQYCKQRTTTAFGESYNQI
jgi:hypothetical protein